MIGPLRIAKDLFRRNCYVYVGASTAAKNSSAKDEQHYSHYNYENHQHCDYAGASSTSSVVGIFPP